MTNSRKKAVPRKRAREPEADAQADAEAEASDDEIDENLLEVQNVNETMKALVKTSAEAQAMSAENRAQTKALCDAMLAAIRGLPHTMTEAIAEVLNKQKAVEEKDPLLMEVMKASFLPESSFSDLNWMNPKVWKEPWFWVLLCNQAVCPKTNILDSFQLAGPLTKQVTGLFEKEWPQERVQSLVEQFTVVAMMANQWVADPAELVFAVRPSVLQARSIIDDFDSKLFTAVRGVRAGQLYREQTGQLAATRFPERGAAAVKSALYSKSGDSSGNGHRGERERNKGGGKGCDRCGAKVAKGQWQEHNAICRKRTTEKEKE
jgi:hypothetical protein